MRLSWAAEAEGLEILRWGSSATRVGGLGWLNLGAKASTKAWSLSMPDRGPASPVSLRSPVSQDAGRPRLRLRRTGQRPPALVAARFRPDRKHSLGSSKPANPQRSRMKPESLSRSSINSGLSWEGVSGAARHILRDRLFEPSSATVLQFKGGPLMEVLSAPASRIKAMRTGL